MKSTASEVAATILSECRLLNIEVSNLKLQKLLYYCEAWSLALENESLFPDDIEAWVHGPVVSSVFHRYKDYRWAPIPEPKTNPTSDKEIREHVGAVLEAYGKFPAFQLERLTHSEKPWMDARKGLEPDMPSRQTIDRNTMKEFYSRQLA